MLEAVRPASSGDIEMLAELALMAVHEQIDARGGHVWAHREAIEIPAIDILRTALDDPESALFVGTIDDAVVGYARAHLDWMRNGELLGVINEVFVVEQAREVGIGELLIEAVVAWATAAGCAGIDATVLPGNRQAKNFFETAHFTARAIVVHRSIK